MSSIQEDFKAFRRQQRINEKYSPLSVADVLLKQKEEEQRKKDKEASMTDAERIKQLRKQKSEIEKELRKLTQNAIENGNAGIGIYHMADHDLVSAWIKRIDGRKQEKGRGDRVNLITCEKKEDISNCIDTIIVELTELREKIGG